MVRQWQDMLYDGRHAHSYMESIPDFVKLAEAYGHVGLRVEDPAELDATLKKAMTLKDKLVFVEVMVDPSEHIYPMQVKASSMDDMWLKKGVKA